MASGSWAFQNGLMKIFDGTISLTAVAIEMLLFDESYTGTQDDTVVGTGAGQLGSGSGAEIVATVDNYARKVEGTGFTNSFAVDNTNNEMEVRTTDPIWTSLGGTTDDTIHGVCMYHDITDDTDSIPVVQWDINDPSGVTTNGGDFTVDFAADGNLIYTH